MPRYKVVVKACEPLLLGQSLPGGNVQSSRPFVAGSVLRGVVARAILAPLGLWRHSGRTVEEGPPPERFRSIFMDEPRVRFGFLYPVREDNSAARERDVFPIPLTARSCKAHKGFEADRGHGVSDQLLGALRREAGGEADWPSQCPKEDCRERLDRMRGYGIRAHADDAASYRQARVSPRTFVRVGLNRMTETAEERILYTLEALMPGGGDLEKPLSFVGYWGMEGAQWEMMQALLNEHLLIEGGGYPLRIGTARARGMGLVRLYLSDGPTPFTPLPERLDRFQPRDGEGRLLDEAHLYFAITLRAPLLVYDAQGRPTTRVSPKVLRAYVNSVLSDLEPLPKASVIEQETWSGWSAAWGLPKPVTPAIAAGSVLAFRAPAGEREAMLAFLQEVEESGLGERRAEGWGEVAACDPFHVIFDAGGAR